MQLKPTTKDELDTAITEREVADSKINNMENKLKKVLAFARLHGYQDDSEQN